MNARRIAFVDHRLDNFHANVFLAALRQELQPRGFTVSGCLSMDDAEGQAWAKKNQVPYFADAEELNHHADYFMVLAPSNPEVHLELCQRVFPFRKPTYVDKTFAPDLATAQKIFALADRYGVAAQTSSALRYTNVQDHIRQVGRDKVRHMVAWGGGRSFGEYAVHPVELVISCLGPEVESMLRRGDEQFSQLLLEFSRQRSAVVNVYVNNDTPFAASVTTDKATRFITVDGAKLFVDSMSGILDFFGAGQPNVDRAETLAIRQILDAAEKRSARDQFIDLV